MVVVVLVVLVLVTVVAVLAVVVVVVVVAADVVLGDERGLCFFQLSAPSGPPKTPPESQAPSPETAALVSRSRLLSV